MGGIIHTVTLWVLDRACRDSHQLREQYGRDITVAVNISAKDLAHSLFHEEAGAIVRRHKLEPANVSLEITETAMMTDPETARSTIRTLSAMASGLHWMTSDPATHHLAPWHNSSWMS